MFEESLQMPFIIRWPGVVPEGIQTQTLIQNIDYGPTFLDIAGADVPAEMQGRSMVPVLKNDCQPTADWRDAIYYAYYENAAVHNVPVHDGVRTERYKAMFYPRTREWNLFDLETDPQEMTSLHADPKYADILRGLQQQYDDLRDFYDVNTAVIPATRGDEQRWRERNAAITKNARQSGPKVRLAFIGDSITQGWEGRGKDVWNEFYGDRDAINLGIGGDRTEHIIWRLTHGNFDKLKPEVAVLMIGTNNTGHFMQDPSEVAARRRTHSRKSSLSGARRRRSSCRPSSHVVRASSMKNGSTTSPSTNASADWPTASASIGSTSATCSSKKTARCRKN